MYLWVGWQPKRWDFAYSDKTPFQSRHTGSRVQYYECSKNSDVIHTQSVFSAIKVKYAVSSETRITIRCQKIW